MDIMCMRTLSPALPVSDDVQVCTYLHLQRSFCGSLHSCAQGLGVWPSCTVWPSTASASICAGLLLSPSYCFSLVGACFTVQEG